VVTTKRLQPRRAPRQDRARATVRSILDAAAYILARDGWAKLTTNKIAERAGVNIASLYQYFPTKEAIAVELQRQHGDQVRQRLRTVLPRTPKPKSFRSLLREIVAAAVEEHRSSPSLHRSLDEELPRSARRLAGGVGATAMAERWRTSASASFRHVPDVELAVFIARTTVHAVLHEASVERPDVLGHPLLVDELVTLLDRYLRRPPT
jgi:AcrR family transcriptional regulator